MKLINAIVGLGNLLTVRDQFKSVMTQRLGRSLLASFSERDFDDFTAEILGVSDFSTAIKIANERSYGVTTEALFAADDSRKESQFYGLCAVIEGMLDQGYISHICLYDITEELVNFSMRHSEGVASDINNQGYRKQLLTLSARCALSALYFPLSDATGIDMEDLVRCVKEATKAEVEYFDVRQFVGY